MQIKKSLENGEISPLRHIILTHIADYLPSMEAAGNQVGAQIPRLCPL